MVKFTETNLEDMPQIAEWIAADPHHANQYEPVDWLTGQGEITFTVEDDMGPAMYVRFDREDRLLRLRTQFMPESETSKERTGKAVIGAMQLFLPTAAERYGVDGIVFKTENLELAKFMQRMFKFEPAGGKDYRLMFSQETANVR
jgi:hypothetical protein